MKVRAIGVVVIVVAIALLASAQSGAVDQGQPSSGRPWWTGPGICYNAVETVTLVGTTSTSIPATALTGRRYLEVCNSLENTPNGSPLLKLRVDGTAPVIGPNTAGKVLGVGDCVQYAASNLIVVRGISNDAGTAVSSTECR